MEVILKWKGRSYCARLDRPLDISIPLRPNGSNPNCFYAPPPSSDPVRAGDFVGSVARGGPLNFFNVHFNPHGNGTHTECVGHISDMSRTINKSLQEFHFMAELVSLFPKKLSNGDRVLEKDLLENALQHHAEALIVRTLPNTTDKQLRNYSGNNPPYFEPAGLKWLANRGCQHLLVDLPSVDREEDEGKLAAHRAWWGYNGEKANKRTITELIFVPNEIRDGLYLINLQISSFEMDAAPSKPVLYHLDKINEF